MSTELTDSRDDPAPAERLRRLADFALAAEGYDLDRTELGLTLVAPGPMAELHARFLGRDGPTDVLSVPIDDLRPGAVPPLEPGGPPISAGDVFVCPAEVESRAARLGVGFDQHMALMVVHGVLHLLGYDHADDAEADVMETRERELLAAFEAAP